MANSIISNIAALNAQSNITNASNKASASIARLSSGQRIQKASDDVSGLATGTALRTQVTTLKTALSNAAQGSSLLQVADGGLSQIIDILQRQKAIATQASSGQLTDTNRALLNQEFTALTAEIDRIASSTNFNGVNLLGGGMGSKTRQSTTAALAAASVVAAAGSIQAGTGAVGVTAASTNAVQAFTTSDAVGTTPAAGASRIYAVANAGTLQFVDSTNTALAAAAYDGIDAAVSGKFSSITLSNVNYGAAGVGTATVTATINGVVFTGTTLAHATQATTTVRNGNTYIQMALGAVDLANAASAALAQSNITNSFNYTEILRTSTVQGVDFTGTRLQGAIGAATTGNVSLRLNTNTTVDIGNFQYVGGATANSNQLTVQINGQTFTATGVNDLIAAGTIMFVDATRNQGMLINLTGLAVANNITNIRTNVTDRNAFISALNTAFSKAGSGLNFAIGSTTTDNIRVALGSAGTNALFNGNSLDVSTAANALAASKQIDLALTAAVSLRSTVGALQSRFNFASNAVQSALENQDAARGVFLDTDVSAESTDYASSQVQLQAGIAVLAQANQLPQALLKLLG